MEIIVWLTVWGVLGYVFAKSKGLDPSSWAVWAICFGPFALIILAFKEPNRERQRHHEHGALAPSGRFNCPECGESIAIGAKFCRFCNAVITRADRLPPLKTAAPIKMTAPVKPLPDPNRAPYVPPKRITGVKIAIGLSCLLVPALVYGIYSVRAERQAERERIQAEKDRKEREAAERAEQQKIAAERAKEERIAAEERRKVAEAEAQVLREQQALKQKEIESRIAEQNARAEKLRLIQAEEAAVAAAKQKELADKRAEEQRLEDEEKRQRIERANAEFDEKQKQAAQRAAAAQNQKIAAVKETIAAKQKEITVRQNEINYATRKREALEALDPRPSNYSTLRTNYQKEITTAQQKLEAARQEQSRAESELRAIERRADN